MHRKVHVARSASNLTPLDRVYLDGVEQALDWVLGQCPDGDMPKDMNPVDDLPRYHIAIVPDGAEKDVRDENGAWVFGLEMPSG